MNNARLNLLQLEQDLATARSTDVIADKRRELARDQTFLLYIFFLSFLLKIGQK